MRRALEVLYWYGPDEFTAIRTDVGLVAELGFAGVVIGALAPTA